MAGSEFQAAVRSFPFEQKTIQTPGGSLQNRSAADYIQSKKRSVTQL